MQYLKRVYACHKELKSCKEHCCKTEINILSHFQKFIIRIICRLLISDEMSGRSQNANSHPNETVSLGVSFVTLECRLPDCPSFVDTFLRKIWNTENILKIHRGEKDMSARWEKQVLEDIYRGCWRSQCWDPRYQWKSSRGSDQNGSQLQTPKEGDRAEIFHLLALSNLFKVFDFRSDTVTRPTPEMLASIFEAEFGDEVIALLVNISSSLSDLIAGQRWRSDRPKITEQGDWSDTFCKKRVGSDRNWTGGRTGR